MYCNTKTNSLEHAAGAINIAADFLSKTEINPIEKLEMFPRTDIETKEVKGIIHSPGIPEEEKCHLHPENEVDEKPLTTRRQYSPSSTIRNTQ